jgi:tetratricopeptide (TPR) repeat protein
MMDSPCGSVEEGGINGTRHGRGKDSPELGGLIDEITVDAYGDDEQLWAFRQAFEDHVAMPAEAFVVGEPVTVMRIDYDGNERRGLTARCRREGVSEQVIAACDLIFLEGSVAARYMAAYRRWLGIEPNSAVSLSRTRRRVPKATEDDFDMTRDVELIAVAVKGNAISCRIPGKERVTTLRPAGLWDVVPGEIIMVTPRRQWRYGGHPYLSGEIKAWRLDIPALGLTPLKLKERGMWDPKDHYWGEPDEPIEEWAKSIMSRGPRPEYEMEQVLPGEDPDTDSILEAAELREAGDSLGAHRKLMSLLAADLRCLDAHAHLGNFVFDHSPEKAIRHYEVGVRIGELSLGEGFDGVLPWGHIENRPLLRCVHGYGLCLWRLGRLKEAEEVFTRMLWLNPTDNQGVRFLLGQVREGKVWHD